MGDAVIATINRKKADKGALVKQSKENLHRKLMFLKSKIVKKIHLFHGLFL